MKMVQLKMIVGSQVQEGTGEDDQETVTTEIVKPMILDAGQVRNFYPRKGDRPGTRILFRNGSAVAVQDTFDEVTAAIKVALAA